MDQEIYERAIKLRVAEENAMRLKASIEADLDVCRQIKTGVPLAEVKRGLDQIPPIFPVVACLEQYDNAMSVESIEALLDSAVYNIEERIKSIKISVEDL